jgi:aminoglycoside 6'-N-acetyltransferase I
MIEIRRLGPDDAGVLSRVAEDVFDAAIDPARLATFLAAPDHLLIVAVEDGLVIGQIAAVILHHPDAPDELYIDNLGVAPAWKRRGIGTRLLDAAVALGRAMDCDQAWVLTEPENLPALRFYEKSGAQGVSAVLFASRL